MTERITSVTAYTTLDFVDGTAIGAGWREEATGVLNVASEDDPDTVELQVELDAVGLDALPNHADRIALTPEQARTVAAALSRHADRCEDTHVE
ncbi:DUF6360 family protein [Halorubrum sp. DTA46]|uniref:DUF6360 family protein n=1 Tax=Halorubrum sp. DTA46 TaxID=3402162 RepID=UPI003AACF3FC